jgi:hypothetical protein
MIRMENQRTTDPMSEIFFSSAARTVPHLRSRG